jgi:hypothetical protein
LRLRNPVYNDRGHKITEVPVKAGQVRAHSCTQLEPTLITSQLIHIPSISLTHVKSVWGEDAEEFKPERWLDPARIPAASETSGGWSGLFIFSEGSRSCIGYRLAILEFKVGFNHPFLVNVHDGADRLITQVILSTYIRNFEFHDTGVTIKHRFANTLQPYVVGEEAKGGQLPLRISLVDAQK